MYKNVQADLLTVHWGLCLWSGKINTNCLFGTLALKIMKYGAFLSRWAYWEEHMQIINVSTHSMSNQNLKYWQGLCFHVNVVCWNGRCKSLYAQWSLSFSPGEEIRTMDEDTKNRFFLIRSVYLENNYWDISPNQLFFELLKFCSQIYLML